MAHHNLAFESCEFDYNINLDDTEYYQMKMNPLSKIQKPTGNCLTFVDFCPEYRRKADSWFFQSQYETLSDLFDKINYWLSENRKWEVKTCETLIYDPTTGFGQDKLFFDGRVIRKNLRAVRLWLAPRLHQRTLPQKVGCINVVPRIKITNSNESQIINKENLTNSVHTSSLITPQFETLDEMLIRVNDLLSSKPINGKILNVETVPIPIEGNNWSVDTECSFWSDNQQQKCDNIFILRIYFEYGTTTREHLEIVDFLPRCFTWDSPLAVPNYESFSSLLTRASQWLREQSLGVRFCSCQTIEIPFERAPDLKVDNGNAIEKLIENRKMFFSKNCSNKSDSEIAIKFLRIAFTRPQDACPESHFPPTRDPVILNCKIFVPTKLISTSNAEYESIEITKRKMEAWLMTTGAKILSSETTIITIPYSSSSIVAAVDSCLKTNSSVLGHYLVVFRIYLDGHYLEPPARLLPSNYLSDSEENQTDGCSIM